MVSANTLCKKLINVNGVVVNHFDFMTDANGVKRIRINARPSKW